MCVGNYKGMDRRWKKAKRQTRKTWKDNVKEDMKVFNIKDENARDRERWRSTITRLTALTGNNWRKRNKLN